MKFVDQNLFDVSALQIATLITQSPAAVGGFCGELFNAYRGDFPGDNLWVDQAKSTAEKLVILSKAIATEDCGYLLARVAEARKALDENLKPISTISKFFSGTFFSKSHPAPEVREAVSLKNGRALLVIVNSMR